MGGNLELIFYINCTFWQASQGNDYLRKINKEIRIYKKIKKSPRPEKKIINLYLNIRGQVCGKFIWMVISLDLYVLLKKKISLKTCFIIGTILVSSLVFYEEIYRKLTIKYVAQSY